MRKWIVAWLFWVLTMMVQPVLQGAEQRSAIADWIPRDALLVMEIKRPRVAAGLVDQ